MHICNFMLIVRNRAIFAVEMPSTVSTPHSKFQVNCTRRFRNELSKIGLVSLLLFFFFLFSSRCESYHRVETGYPIALKFDTQKGDVRAHLGTKFG